MQTLIHALMSLRRVDHLWPRRRWPSLESPRRFSHQRRSDAGSAQFPILVTGTRVGLLIDAARNYRFPLCITLPLQKRQEQQTAAIRTIAYRTQLRLNHRYRQLKSRGVQHNKIRMAIARALVGFIWDISRTSRNSTPSSLHNVATGVQRRSWWVSVGAPYQIGDDHPRCCRVAGA